MIVAFACIRTSIMCKCSKIEFSPDSARNVKSQQLRKQMYHFSRRRKNTQFRLICLCTLDSTQEIYIPSNSQETSLQTYKHIVSLEVKMVEILADLNWK